MSLRTTLSTVPGALWSVTRRATWSAQTPCAWRDILRGTQRRTPQGSGVRRWSPYRIRWPPAGVSPGPRPVVPTSTRSPGRRRTLCPDRPSGPASDGVGPRRRLPRHGPHPISPKTEELKNASTIITIEGELKGAKVSWVPPQRRLNPLTNGQNILLFLYNKLFRKNHDKQVSFEYDLNLF